MPSSAIEKLGEGLRTIWERFRPCFKTQTRDGSEYAWIYLRGLLTMDTERNYARACFKTICDRCAALRVWTLTPDAQGAGRMVIYPRGTLRALSPFL